MLKVNTQAMAELTWDSPKRKFGGAGKQVSEALGRDRDSTDLLKRHPFDVEIQRISPGLSVCPYHAESAQWEFYHVISGHGSVRHEGGVTPIGPGDAFLFKPGEPHQLSNLNPPGSPDLVLYVVADNPIGDTAYYPDSQKWLVGSPERRLMRSDPVDCFDEEE